MFRPSRSNRWGVGAAVAAASVLGFASVGAQDRLAGMPGYSHFVEMQPKLQGVVVSGAINAQWDDDGQSFSYATGGKAYRFDVASGTATVTGDAPTGPAGRGFGRGGGQAFGGRGGRGGRGQTLPDGTPNPCGQQQVERGRQSACAPSPDGKMKAYYRDRNLYLSNADGSGEVAITTDGSEKDRIEVRRRELGVRRGARPDHGDVVVARRQQVAFYRFDESQVHDYFLQTDQTEIQDSLDVEAYPKPGTPNPIADVLVYDVATKQTTKLDVRDGKPFTNDVVGHYVYDVRWSPDGGRAAHEPHQPAAADHGIRRVQPVDGEVPRRRARELADRLGRQPAADAAPRRQQPLHLGVGPQRLDELLPLRSDRQADQSDHQQHHVRGRPASSRWTRTPA